MGRQVVCDIEANGLFNVKDIWCIGALDINTKEEFLFHPKEKSDCPDCCGKGILGIEDDPWASLENLTYFNIQDTSKKCEFCYGTGYIYKGNHEEFKDDFIQFANEVDEWIGHNFVSYDSRVIEDVLNYRIHLNKITDTLVLSRLFRPVSPFKNQAKKFKNWDTREGGHSLDAWGRRLGENKLKFNDFSKFSDAQLVYMQQDLQVNYKVYRKLMQESKGFSNLSIRLEHKVAKMLTEQEENGFFLIKENAQALKDETEKLLTVYEKYLKELFPPRYILYKTITVKHNKDGNISKVTQNQLNRYHHDMNEDGTINLYILQEFNPRSPQQIGERLLDLGWNPKKLTPTGQPAVDKDSLGEAIDELRDKHENVKYLEMYNIIGDRHGKAEKWLQLAKDRGDGRVHGKINPIGAGTHRCSHFDDNMANIASVRTIGVETPDNPNVPMFSEVNVNGYTGLFIEYNEKKKEAEIALKGLEGVFGWDSRNCWGAPTDDRSLCIVGADASGIQLRALAHYMNDDKYTKALLEEDIHVVNQKAADLPSRKKAKTFIYAWLLGAGDPKIGRICGIEENEIDDLIKWGREHDMPWGTNVLVYLKNKYAKQNVKFTKEEAALSIKGMRVKQKFLDNTPALKRLKKDDIPKATKQGYLLGLDGRKLWIPNEHLAMSMYLQGFEAVIMKAAMSFYQEELDRKKIPFKQVAFVHDEFQIETRWDCADEVGQAVVNGLKKAGDFFKTNCPIDGEYKVGKTWAQTH